MAKRFTDTGKWAKPFLRTMKAPYKLLWIYILDECDHAGIWQVDFEVAQIKIGEKLNQEQAMKFFEGKIVPVDNGSKWFIFDFIDFQYGDLNTDNRVHHSVIKVLEKYKIDLKNKPLTSPLQGAKDKDKDKDKEKDKDKDKGTAFQIFDLGFVDSFILETYKAYLQMRKSIKKQFQSQLSVEFNYKQLIKLSGGDLELAKTILEQSIANQWQGLFEVKNAKPLKKSVQTDEELETEIRNRINAA